MILIGVAGYLVCVLVCWFLFWLVVNGNPACSPMIWHEALKWAAIWPVTIGVPMVDVLKQIHENIQYRARHPRGAP